MSPHETKEKEGGVRRSGIDNTEKCRWSCPSTLNPETTAVRPMRQHKTGEKERGGERTWSGARKFERKDEARETAKGKTTAGAENVICQNQPDQTTSYPGHRRIQQGPKSPDKDGSRQEPSVPIPETSVVGPVNPRETN